MQWHVHNSRSITFVIYFLQAVALLLVSVVVLVVCFINLILFEMMEWKEIFGPRLELVNPHQTDLTAIFFGRVNCNLCLIYKFIDGIN